ncbi:MAG: hypothetical protein RJB09_1839, partial [Pseudomonadota bacterium]
MHSSLRVLPRGLVALGQSTFMGRGKARRLLLRMLDALKVKRVQTTFKGIPYLFHLDNATERRAIFGRYDDRELEFLFEHMKIAGNVFVDIGANSGFYTNFILAKSAPGTTVIAIEPNPELTARIHQNASLLSPSQRNGKTLIVEQKAISDAPRLTFLDVGRGLGGACLIDVEREFALRVEAIPLLTLLNRHGVDRIDALKIDVEGHEDRVLTPFLAAAPETLLPRSIVIEHTSGDLWKTDVLRQLLDMGYTTVARTRG